jgi:hypothetical protein
MVSETNKKKAWQKWGHGINLDELAEKWPSPFVSRNRFEEFSS